MQRGLPCRWDLTNGESIELDGDIFCSNQKQRHWEPFRPTDLSSRPAYMVGLICEYPITFMSRF